MKADPGRRVERRRITAAMLGLLAIVAWPASVEAQSRLSGLWRGEIVTPAGSLTLMVTLEGGGTGTIAVPDRSLSGIPITGATLSDDGSVTFKVPADGAAFEGHFETDLLLVGEWIQVGQRIPIEFERVGEATEKPTMRPRRQTPQPPFPYTVEEVVVQAGERLACTLTRPEASDGPVPGAVLLTVAGPNDRDQAHSGHKPYMVLADHLTREGMAVLRCDDRGVGGSEGDLAVSSVDDLVMDALGLIGHLASRDGVGPVGIIGNSEGSVVGSLAAAQAPEDIAFVVLLGGVGVRGAAVIRERLLAQALVAGQSLQEAQALVAPFDSLARVVTEAGGIGVAELERTRPEVLAALRAIAVQTGADDPFLPADLDERVSLFAGPWYHAQVTLDGGAILERVPVPVLALTGSKDRTNLPDQNLPAIRGALERAGNPDVQVAEVPDLNHVFQTAVSGGSAEYGRLEESFSPVGLQMIAEWILRRFGAPDA